MQKKDSNNPKYVAYRDLIGLTGVAKQKNLKNRDFFPIGVVIDETYNTIITTQDEDPKSYNNSIKTYIKNQYVFRFTVIDEADSYIIEVDGEKLLKRPENRLKLLKKKNWRR